MCRREPGEEGNLEGLREGSRIYYVLEEAALIKFVQREGGK